MLGIGDGAGDAPALPSTPPQPEDVRLPPSLPAPSPSFGHLNWEELMLSLLVVALSASAVCVDAASQNAACLALLPCPQDGHWDLVPKPSHP